MKLAPQQAQTAAPAVDHLKTGISSPSTAESTPLPRPDASEPPEILKVVVRGYN